MKINNRLRSVASLVDCNTSIIDVGCDHALLSIYIYLNKENVKVTASDVNEGPLKKAKENIIKYNLEDKINLKLNDGIKNINGFDTVIISGMGGINISNILKEGNLNDIKNIIVSPNNDIKLVKRTINKLGYYLNNELIVKEKGKFYFILDYKKGNKNNKNYLLLNKDKIYLEYLNKELDKNIIINKNLNFNHIFKKLNILYKIFSLKKIIKKF